MTAVRAELEANSEGFTPSRLLDVRDRTRAALWEIAGRMAPGMSEEDARSTATDVLRVRRLRKGWHKVLVRFGPNTTLNFDDPSHPDVVLGEDDIFFVDI